LRSKECFGVALVGSPLLPLEVIPMWVRVARFEGGTAEGLDAEMARSKQVMEKSRGEGLPPGLESVTRVMEAINRAEGTGLAIIFCDTEEDMRRADEALNNMSPPAEGSGRRVSAGVYEVMHDVDMT
jgi:hypothetical protein